MLGGMSWESSAQYYRLANELVRERLGGLHSARIVLTSVDFADVESCAMEAPGVWGAQLRGCALELTPKRLAVAAPCPRLGPAWAPHHAP